MIVNILNTWRLSIIFLSEEKRKKYKTWLNFFYLVIKKRLSNKTLAFPWPTRQNLSNFWLRLDFLISIQAFYEFSHGWLLLLRNFSDIMCAHFLYFFCNILYTLFLCPHLAIFLKSQWLGNFNLHVFLRFSL